MPQSYLSIDVGGTNIKFGILDRAGHIMEHHKTETPNICLDEFSAEINRIIDKYQNRVRGIAFSVPGKVDTSIGIVYHGGSLPFLDGLNFKKRFATKNELPIAVENDGKSAALAELWLGNLKQVNSGVAVVLGTGVGGGIVLNGKLLYGEHLQAGELSLMINNSDQEDLSRSLSGFNLSSVAMIRQAGQKLGLGDPQDGRAVFDYINRHDALVWPIFKGYTQRLARLLITLQGVLDVDRFVIGGGISAQSIVTQSVNNELQILLDSNPLLAAYLNNFDVKQAHFANDANLYGALYSFLLQIDEERLSHKTI
ncbi:hypothetical protein B9J76_08285 [Lacticaseibacillus paracasei]|uniref:ROK family protein n=1 Tax=Lacticaseibacillus paracasei TaxID=1597 RepID=UPI000A1F2EFF|nr:ROK family protein [Lacticaseibacillus paracasei]OSP84437.1 hypothetical protein B9J76_08285 [Lacticaseibacillus paracasei]